MLTAAQQSIRLHRLSCHRHPNTNLRRLLSKRDPELRTGSILPRRAQVYSWQLSAVFLTLSVLCMLGGMFILIWSSTGSGAFASRSYKSWWNSEAKLAVTFSSVGLIILATFVFEQVTLYSWNGRYDSEQAE